MSPENTVIQPFAPLSGHEYSHNPPASIPEPPPPQHPAAFRRLVLCGPLRAEGLLGPLRKRGTHFPPNPRFQGKAFSQLISTWNDISFTLTRRSSTKPAPGRQKGPAEEGPSYKAFNWSVIRPGNLCRHTGVGRREKTKGAKRKEFWDGRGRNDPKAENFPAS